MLYVRVVHNECKLGLVCVKFDKSVQVEISYDEKYLSWRS